MTSVADCFEKGLLKKGVKQPDLARKDLLRSAFFLKEAQDMLEANKPVMAVLALYNALFHCARSLLFADGITERSHHCVARYVDTQYVQTGKMQAKFLDAFETVMGIRHAAQYSTEEIRNPAIRREPRPEGTRYARASPLQAGFLALKWTP